MRREDKKKLTINRRIIVTHLVDLESVLDYLIAKQIFTPAMRERIIYETKVPSDRIRQTLDYLITRNALAFQYFLEALVLTDNNSIVDVLDPEYTSSEPCRLLLEREKIIQAAHSNRNNINRINELNHDVNNRQLPFPVTCTDHHYQNQNNLDLFMYQLSSSRQLHQPSNSINLKRLIQRQPQLPSILNKLSYGNQFVSNSVSSSASRSSSSSSSNCPSGTASNSSMSPTIQRNRSSSVTATISCYANTKKISRKSVDEQEINSVIISESQQQQQQQLQQQPSTYNLDWNDVNELELDFIVYNSMPNIRKQLSPDECYQMEQLPRGICLIINNENFYENGSEVFDLRRVGTDMDASRLKNLFEKLHFNVEMHIDLKTCEMRQTITAFANECNLNSNNFDAISLIILTHGTDGFIHGVDIENKLNLDSVLNIFDDVLVGKPKLFIFQACRGEYLNQKDSFLNINSQTSSSKIQVPMEQSSSSNKPLPPSLVSLLHKPPSIPSSANCNVLEEKTIRKFEQLKMSSSNHCTKQMMFKKNTPSNTASILTSISTSAVSSILSSPTANKNESITQSISSNELTTPAKNTSITRSELTKAQKKARSRSHSRSNKYSNYLASAATAILSAIKTSPNASSSSPSSSSSSSSTTATKSMLNSIATQTSSSGAEANNNNPTVQIEPSSSNSANCYLNSSIITSISYNRNQSIMNFIDGRPIKTSLPSRSDFFIWYSSVRGFVSHRDVDGSPFIKCLVTVFSRCSYELELIEMVRKVNMLMQQYEKIHFDERNAVAFYFMVPVAEFHLTKRLYFNP